MGSIMGHNGVHKGSISALLEHIQTPQMVRLGVLGSGSHGGHFRAPCRSARSGGLGPSRYPDMDHYGVMVMPLMVTITAMAVMPLNG